MLRAEVKKTEQMTPLERVSAEARGEVLDRPVTVPFVSEMKPVLFGYDRAELLFNPKVAAEADIRLFNRFGQDRIVIGPNTRGITEAFGRVGSASEWKCFCDKEPFVQTYDQLSQLEPINAFENPRTLLCLEHGKYLSQASELVPIEMSIGGPFTIAGNLRGIERLLRDCRKEKEQVLGLLRIITDSQKSCIDLAASLGYGIAMADPVANPMLIGEKMYETFVFPFTKELTEYAREKTGKLVSLHMCGKTDKIWKYFKEYSLNEVSLDNIVDFEKAALELGDCVRIAGNVDPVQVVLNGTKEEIFKAVEVCMRAGMLSKAGYHLTTGCDVPEMTEAKKIEWLIEATKNNIENIYV